MIRPEGDHGVRPLLGVLILLNLTGCASVGRSHDYMLGITCAVVDSAGRPIENADILLRLGRVAYQAITPVEEDRRTSSGGVVFMYITHELSTPYVLTVRKTGYQEARVTGVAASGPAGVDHKITLTLADQK